ncbi:FG-GAP-like repeat-containing protein [Thermodesulfobacteriota bacterium]
MKKVITTGFSIILLVLFCSSLHAELSFTLDKSFYNGGELEKLLVADIDGDGENDIVTTSSTFVKIFINQGNGNFPPPSTPPYTYGVLYETGGLVSDIISDDFNNDGFIDLATIAIDHYHMSTISVLMNNGDGTFANSFIYEMYAPIALNSGDFDRDGDVDLLVKHASSYYGVSILDNDGNGNFILGYRSGSVSDPDPSAGYADSVDVTDLNNDGWLDFMVGKGPYPADNVIIYLNNGDGTFDNSSSFSFGSDLMGSLFLDAVQFSDLNGDGHEDIVLNYRDNVSFVLNDGTGHFINEEKLAYTVGFYDIVVLSDFDYDGDIDIGVARSGYYYMYIHLNDGVANFTSWIALNLNTFVTNIESADINGDGFNDLVVGGTTNVSNYFYTVPNSAPTIVAISVPKNIVAVNEEVSFHAQFVDPDELDTHFAVWDWGDGTSSYGVVDYSGSTLTVTGTHVYASAGVYSVTLSVTDAFGESDTSTYQYVVAYDPDAGFVTGGGWIYSAEGAYIPNPLLAGQANFGFVSKYKKGTTVPTGNTEFQFHAGDFNFHSDNYDWMVVTGGNFAKFKGLGAINDEGTYKFQLWAGDETGIEGEDTFRIKIWTEDELTSAETIIYDNGLDQEIEGGSIVVHTKK